MGSRLIYASHLMTFTVLALWLISVLEQILSPNFTKGWKFYFFEDALKDFLSCFIIEWTTKMSARVSQFSQMFVYHNVK